MTCARRALMLIAHWSCLVCGVSLLCVIVGASSLLTGPAYASVGGCYSDPVVVLSNGVTVELASAIADQPGDVQSVVYTLHAPVGTTVVQALRTPGPLSHVESFQFVADAAPGTYVDHTMVTTGTPAVGVVASLTLARPVGSLVGPSLTTGTSGQDLVTSLSL